MKKISWGIMSTAKIGLKNVIPAMQKGNYTEINAIASRSLPKAKKAAAKLKIPRVYGSYQELLEDANIEAVYIPLPNHLHVEWTLKALKAGKHVLCEKPLGMNLKEVEYLYKETKKYPDLKVMEAFMYRFHPQWQRVIKMVNKGMIGEVKTINSFFSYYNDNPKDIRNQADIGGGGLLDIGCYCISQSRFLFNCEPARVCALIEYDPVMKIDRLVSAVLDFKKGTATFTCATQVIPYQRANIFGTRGSIEIQIPFNAPPDKQCKIIYKSGPKMNSKIKEITFNARDQYTIQGDLFSQSIIKNKSVPTPLDDAVANMKVIKSIIQSARTGSWAIV